MSAAIDSFLKDRPVLISNDDGIHAEGLAVLERVMRRFTSDVWVVAPESEQSGASHSLTITRPLRPRRVGDRRFTVDGTPTDCVLLAINKLMDGHRPALVLSGINHGGNIGDDVTYSGTIAAAMEGALLGVPSIAVSQDYDKAGTGVIDWRTADAWLPEVILGCLSVPWPADVLLNVNLPDRAPDAVTGIRVVRHGKRKIGDDIVERMDPRGRPYVWIGALRGPAETADDTDIHVVGSGGIAVTPLGLDLTRRDMLQPLSEVFTTRAPTTRAPR